MKTAKNNPSGDINVGDMLHFFRALEEPDRENGVSYHRSETEHVNHPVVPEFGYEIQDNAEDDHA